MGILSSVKIGQLSIKCAYAYGILDRKKRAEGMGMRNLRAGFTIVELMVVIAVIGIIAAISIVGYGSWQTGLGQSRVKSDLSHAASAMESAKTFNNTYPLSLPTDVVASDGVTLALSSASTTTFCIDGYLTATPTTAYHVDNIISKSGPEAGSCSSRTNLPLPDVPANVAIVSSYGSTVQLSWLDAANATGYVAQCAVDPAFIVGAKNVTVTSTTASITGLALNSSFYCRTKAVNSTGSSAWSSAQIAQTSDKLGSLPVATSLEGYWSTAPEGFLIEDGSAVSRTTYSALFAVIGTSFGVGDGTSTFNVPDSRGRASVNQSATDTEFDTIGEKYGTKTETLSVAQMPSHTHVQNAHTHVQDAHAHGVADPGHNHTQNAHTHGMGRTPDGNAMGLCCGGQDGWSLWPGTNNAIFRLIFTSVAATNNGAYTGISYASTTATNQSTVATNQNNGGGGSHNNIMPSIVKSVAIKYSVVDSAAPSLPAGTSIQGYWPSTPRDYAAEDGAAYSRIGEAALYAAISTTYGTGDGSTTFNVPDSRGRVAVNKSLVDTEFDTMGEKTGTKTETLTIAQMPSHTHIQNAHTHIQDAHTHTVIDPGHNHTQNPHNHDARNTPNGDVLGMDGGGGGGWGLAIGNTNNNIYKMFPTYTAATNNPALTGVGVYNATATNQNTTAVNQNTGGDGAHNNIQPSIVRKSVIKKTDGLNSNYSLPAGSSIAGYWATAPSGYLIEDGSAVSRTTYATLFTAIGTAYGTGDGSTTFNLPDSRGRIAVNKSSTDTEFDILGEKPGSKTETLTIAQMPSHTHIQNAHTHVQNAHTHSVYDPGHNHTQNAHSHYINNTQNGDYAGMAGGVEGGWGIANNSNNNIFRIGLDNTTATNNGAYTGVTLSAFTATNQSTVATNQNTGGGGSHNNIQPTIVKLYVIKY